MELFLGTDNYSLVVIPPDLWNGFKGMGEGAAIAISPIVFMVVLDIVLIPAHGGAGASVASTVSYSAGGVAVAVIFARTVGVPIRIAYVAGADVPRTPLLSTALFSAVHCT